MPPRASSRLDLRLISSRAAHPASALLLELGRRGVSAETIVAGGADELVAVDLERERFLHSGQGGFRVGCPECGAELAGPLARELDRWREGGAREMRCPECGVSKDLDAFEYRPPAAFARTWLEVINARDAELSPHAAAVVAEFWPDLRVLWHRR